MNRVVVTGLGVVSAIGNNVSEFWDSLSEGRSGIGPMEKFDSTRLRFHNAAEVRNFDPSAHFEPKMAEMYDPFAQFAIVAAREAVSGSGIEWTDDLKARTGVITGSCTGGQTSEDEAFVAAHQGERVSILTVPRVMANAGSSGITMDHGITGPAFTIASACASSNHAIGQAFWMVRHGVIDAAIAGGSDAPFSFMSLKAWEALRVVASDTCRPFSKNRTGMILGEGAGMLMLETLEGARARGARIHAEVVGFGMTSDAHHITQPAADGAARAMSAALRDGGIAPEQIGYINAHGTATLVNDPMETSAIRIALGGHAERIPISSTKSMHGHTLGAAGAIEAVATILAMEHGVLPPTANFIEPDPKCDLDVIANKARPAQVEYALSNTFAFGGLNAVLAFRRWDH